jgi:hypothetical protein
VRYSGKKKGRENSKMILGHALHKTGKPIIADCQNTINKRKNTTVIFEISIHTHLSSS